MNKNDMINPAENTYRTIYAPASSNNSGDDGSCAVAAGPVITRPMTEEEWQRYGRPAIVTCPECGNALPQTRNYFGVSESGHFHPVCIRCARGGRRQGRQDG